LGKAIKSGCVDALFTIASDVLAVVFGDDEENIRFFRGKEGAKNRENEDKEQAHRIVILNW
jgi:hypothetical protein